MAGTNLKGLETSFGQVGEFEDLSDIIRDASGYDTPLFSYLARGKATNLTHEWIEDARRKTTTTLAANVTTSISTVTVADGTMFVIGDTILVDSEVMRISNISGSSLTVSRGWGGTAGGLTTFHASGATVIRLGYAGIAGADAPSANTTLKTRKSNYVQSFENAVFVSFEERGQRNVGGDEYDYQVAKRMKEHAVAMELSILYGAKKIGTATTPSTSGGLKEFITTTTFNFSGTITQAQFESKLRTIYTNAGADKPDLLLVSPVMLEAMLFWARGTLRTTLADKKIGVEVMQAITPYGIMDVLLDRHLVSGQFFALQTNALKWCPLKGDNSYDTKLYPLARTGSYDKAMILTMATLERTQEAAHGFFSGVTGGA